jgi:hypothetical protein
MTRFPNPEMNDVTDPRVKAVYEEIVGELGFGIVPNLFKSMAINPGFLESTKGLMRAWKSQWRNVKEGCFTE